MPFLSYLKFCQDPSSRLGYPKQDPTWKRRSSQPSKLSLRRVAVEGHVSAQEEVSDHAHYPDVDGFPVPGWDAGQAHSPGTGKRDIHTPFEDLRSHVPGRTAQGGSARNHMRGLEVRAWAEVSETARFRPHVPHRRPQAAPHRQQMLKHKWLAGLKSHLVPISTPPLASPQISCRMLGSSLMLARLVSLLPSTFCGVGDLPATP
jgi:hypothetical protein